MSSVIPIPWYQRINLRMLIVGLIVVVPVGAIVYTIVDQMVNKGQWAQNDARYGSYTLVDLQQMSSFEMDQTTATNNSIPEDFRKLDGKRVMLKGEMFNGSATGNSAQMSLVFSIQKCCVGASPKIQHFIKLTAPQGQEIQYYPGLVRVVGTLKVGVEKEGGAIASVYRMTVERVEPVQ
jgi:hypothetical protein